MRTDVRASSVCAHTASDAQQQSLAPHQARAPGSAPRARLRQHTWTRQWRAPCPAPQRACPAAGAGSRSPAQACAQRRAVVRACVLFLDHANTLAYALPVQPREGMHGTPRGGCSNSSSAAARGSRPRRRSLRARPHADSQLLLQQHLRLLVLFAVPAAHRAAGRSSCRPASRRVVGVCSRCTATTQTLHDGPDGPLT